MFRKKAADESFKSSFVRIARKLGFLCPEKAAEADRLIEASPEASSEDIVIQAKLLTEEQAHEVDAERQTIDIQGFLADKFKRAHGALGEVHSSAQRLHDSVTQPISVKDVLAAKRKVGI